jgi:hypothetical protein
MLAATLTVALLTATSQPVIAAGAVPDYAAMVAKLKPGMSVNQVAAVFGESPASVTDTTCDEYSELPWPCRVESFGDWEHGADVFFARTPQGVWFVRRWKVN